jgi:hypothetical protein
VPEIPGEADLPAAVVAGLHNWKNLPAHIRAAVEALLGGSDE